ncbi:MAG: alpha/beta hydrolase [Roseivirga sp.]|nr:alpha/beta hydrolase [Roseivirga sp.]
MKKTFLLTLLLFAQHLSAQKFDMAGSWLGSLDFSGRTMDILITFEQTEGKLTGNLSSEKQQLKDIGISNIQLSLPNLKFDIPLAGGKWTGTVNQKEGRLEGNWIQGPYKATLNLVKQQVKPQLRIKDRSQTPQAPFPYDIEEVSFINQRDETILAGTLTLPKGTGPFPAAILLTVAGPNDRDQSHGSPQHKPFLVLADHLTRQGFAVLRADDRGIGGSTGDLFQSTIEDFAHDALAGFELLKQHQRIDPEQIGFIGNSEGTLVGPMAAAINKETAFIVTLGGMGIPGAEVILDQVRAIGQLGGLDETEVAKLRAHSQELFGVIRNELDSKKVAQKLRILLENSEKPDMDERLFLVPKSIEEQIKIFSSPWYRYQVDFDPAPFLQSITCPFLALHGSQDPFVAPDKNLAAIAAHLRKAGNQQYATMLLPGLNHVFQDATSGSPLLYNENEISFSPRALTLISSWLKVSLKMKP